VHLWDKFRLRLRRQRLRARAIRKGRALEPVVMRAEGRDAARVLLASTVRNERLRLPYFLSYYRKMGIGHFLFIDNASDDGTGEYLAAQPDVSLWRARGSYAASRFGMDWINAILSRHCHDRWVLTVDADEFLVYPFCDSRPIDALTDWLDAGGARSFPAMLLDMYPKGPVGAQTYHEGQNPFEIASHFDSGNYVLSRNPLYGNLWIQGGPRARVFFPDRPQQAPSLNKIPLVKWLRRGAYVHSTHMALPRKLNMTYDTTGGERIAGCLLHAKFLSIFPEKVAEELTRAEHFADSQEYRAYAEAHPERTDLWCRWSESYLNWRQLEILGLMSSGSWA